MAPELVLRCVNHIESAGVVKKNGCIIEIYQIHTFEVRSVYRIDILKKLCPQLIVITI